MAPPDLILTKVVLSTVKPVKSTAHLKCIDPTPSDMHFADFYVPILLAYRLADKSDSEYLRLVNRTKESLGRVLIPFFCFAGRWIAGGSRGRQLMCNDAGVPFIEATLDEELDAVVHASLEFREVPELQGHGFVGMNFTTLKQEVTPDGLPPVFVQITRFRCGGVTLAVNFNHIHTDLKGFFNFMTAWSDLSRDGQTAAKVDHNSVLPDEEQNREPNLQKDIDHDHCCDSTRPWAVKAFEVSAAVVDALKREAKSKESGPGFVSTQDCIAAHIWTSMARLPSTVRQGREPAITLVMEGRRKFFDPPLSDDLCGNVLTAYRPPYVAMEQLAVMPLVSAACKLREQLETTPKEEWRSMKKLRECLEANESGKFAVVSISSWFRAPLYAMDFGAGKPFFATRVGTLWSNSRASYFFGTVSIGPPIPTSSSSGLATVSFFSFPEILEALQSDPLFLSFFLQKL